MQTFSHLSGEERELRSYADVLLQDPIGGFRLVLPFLKQALRFAPAISAAEKLPLAGLLRDCWVTCIRDQCWPTDYFKLRLYQESRCALAHSFFHERMVLCLLDKLNDNEEAQRLADKLTFAVACTQLRIPHVDTIAYFPNGSDAADHDCPAELPEQSLYVKYSQSRCGSGVNRWFFDPQLRAYCHGGETLSSAALIGRVRELAAGQAPSDGECEAAAGQVVPGTYLIQRELKNHELMERFSNGTLGTVRVLTARACGGPPQVIVAALRMATGSSDVDNFAAGGLASSIDVSTGILGKAMSHDPRLADCDDHPDSGQRITGEVIPFWDEVLELSVRAHGFFPKVSSVGWDVAITSEGVRLLEANPTWGSFVVQLPHGVPLGRTALPAMLMSHVAALDPAVATRAVAQPPTSRIFHTEAA